MKNLIKSILVITLWFSLSSSGCDGGGSSSNVQTIAPGNSNTGVSGSLARFTIANNYLYALHNDSLKVFEINIRLLNIANQMHIGNSIETIYPFGNQLFIAGNNGMSAYDITNPKMPTYVGYISHVTGCDPVVANSTNVFLTIHGGATCHNSNVNELQIYQLNNPFNNSVFLKSVKMVSPLGLGLKNNTLFVCDRGVGIYVFDVTTPTNPIQICFVSNPIVKDVIPYNNILVAMTETGIAYYDITNPNITKFLSQIK